MAYRNLGAPACNTRSRRIGLLERLVFLLPWIPALVMAAPVVVLLVPLVVLLTLPISMVAALGFVAERI